jgi:holo-[acyl-carrier protein] synthase
MYPGAVPIVAVGIDLVSLQRLAKVYHAHPHRFLERHFAPQELEYCLALSDPLPSLAARFAAKEAFRKCWSHPLAWRSVWVDRQEGVPRYGFAPELAEELRKRRLFAHLSLAHEREYALALAVLEELPG